MIRTPTRYHPAAIRRENPQTAEAVTAVTGNSHAFAGARTHAPAHMCKKVTQRRYHRYHSAHFRCGLPTLSAKQHLVTTTMNENYIDDCRTPPETAQIRRKTLGGPSS